VNVPIRVRMTAWYVALLALIIAAVGAFLVVRLRADLTDSLDGTLGPAAQQIALGYHAEGVPEVADTSATVLSGERAASQVLDRDGRVVTAYGDRVARTPMLDAAQRARVLAGASLKRTETLGPRGRRFRLAARATTWHGTPVVVVAAESMASVDRSVRRVLVLLLIAGPAALAATALGGWWLARRSLRPVQRLTTEAQAIGVDRLGDRLAVPGTGDEIARLATTINMMLSRIQAGVDAQQRLIADTSHELRTPLAAMRAELDVSLRADPLEPAARAVLESTRDEVDRMSRTVDDLLVLASADEGRLALETEPVDVATVAAGAVRALAPLAHSRATAVELDARPAPARADAGRLGQAIGNLIDNAIKYSPPGATVRVATTTAGEEAVVTVDDEGPGIPDAVRDRIFDRFFRADASRTRATGGSGIGLAIVREVAHAHGGRAVVAPRPGGGSTFTIAIPVGPRPAPDAQNRTVNRAPPSGASPAATVAP
jgi:heavy metal sensor kinase